MSRLDSVGTYHKTLSGTSAVANLKSSQDGVVTESEHTRKQRLGKCSRSMKSGFGPRHAQAPESGPRGPAGTALLR
jgi:hypothetical protein